MMVLLVVRPVEVDELRNSNDRNMTAVNRRMRSSSSMLRKPAAVVLCVWAQLLSLLILILMHEHVVVETVDAYSTTPIFLNNNSRRRRHFCEKRTMAKKTTAPLLLLQPLSHARMMSNTDENLSTSSSSFRPDTNFGSENVPESQRPINEYLDVTNQPFFTWARDTDSAGLLLRFLLFYSLSFALICYPISSATFTQEGYLIHKILSSNVGAMFVSMLLLFRIYSGYDYIGQRLQSTYIEYEETGWYDGDFEKKGTTELMRDRMLYTSQVEPIVNRLKTFVIVGTSYFIGSILLLKIVVTQYPVMFDQYDPTVLNRLSYDDKLADTAAINTNGQPAYCDSRYYRAIANGGLGCK